MAKPRSQWPNEKSSPSQQCVAEIEKEAKSTDVIAAILAGTVVRSGEGGLTGWKNRILNHYGDYTRMVRIMAWCLRALTSTRKMKVSVCATIVNDRRVAFLSGEEVADAELFILREVQSIAFPEIYISLQKGEAPNHKDMVRLQDLRLVWDSRRQLIRVTGRRANWLDA